jgi:hypothetical protein
MPQQRDIFMVAYQLPQGIEYHPAIMISSEDIYEIENIFYAVMCSSEIQPEEFSLELTPEMIVGKKPMDKTTYIKTHLLQSYFPGEISRHIGSVTLDAFDRIKSRICKSIFEGCG